MTVEEALQMSRELAERAEAMHRAEAELWWTEFAWVWCDVGYHIAGKDRRRQRAAARREKSRGSWGKA